MAHAVPPAAAADQRAPGINASVLGLPPGPGPFIRQGPKGVETYLIPAQLDDIRHLPEPERSNSLRTIQQHQDNFSFLQQTIVPFFSRLQARKLQAQPEYAMDLREVVMAIDFAHAADRNPLFEHEPLLLALPPYTKTVLLAPEEAIPKVRERLKALAMSKRVRVVASQQASHLNAGNGITQWVRDIMLVANEHGVPLLMAPLAYENYADLAHNDLAYLSRVADQQHHFLQAPIFFQGGNLAVAKAGRKLLLVGAEEIAANQHWFSAAFGFQPRPTAVPDILKAVTGAHDVLILPNSRNLYHLDLFIAPLADGLVGLLAPVDPEHLLQEDRDVLTSTGELLKQSGFQIVPIPTNAERIRNFESATNIVSFIDRRNGRRRALVPQFPEAAGTSRAQSLNQKALDAYRRAGITPTPVEDRFHEAHGNIHCAVVPFH